MDTIMAQPDSGMYAAMAVIMALIVAALLVRKAGGSGTVFVLVFWILLAIAVFGSIRGGAYDGPAGNPSTVTNAGALGSLGDALFGGVKESPWKVTR